MRQTLGVILLTSAAMAALASPPRPFAFEHVRFEANRGQTGTGVRFVARAPGQQVFLTDSGVAISTRGGGVTMRFEGASRPDWRAVGSPAETISYFIGKDPSRWVKGAPVYERIVWRNAYPGIDVAFYGAGEKLEYDLIVAPGADPSRIRVRFDGGGVTQVLKDGTVRIAVGSGTIRQLPPSIYQELSPGHRVPVTGRFVACGANRMRLELGSYHSAVPLVVDPVLEASSYFGGENDDEIVAIADGFVAGNTRSLALPDAFREYRNSRDVFVRGTGQVIPGQNTSMTTRATVVFGGSSDEELGGISIDSLTQMVLVAGTTTSTDMPSTGSGAGSTYRGGASDGFIAVIYVSGFAAYLNSSRYVGGSGEDRILAISGYGWMYAYVGQTDSPDLASGGAPIQTLQGGKDAFYGIKPFSSSTEILGYLGGSGDDVAYTVSVRHPGSVWIGGETRSPDFPSEAPGISGASDAFLTSVTITDPYTSTPSVSHASFRFGGNGEDSIRAIVATPASAPASFTDAQVVSPGTVTGIGIAGVTTSTDLAVSPAAQAAPGGGRDGFAGIWDETTKSPRWLSYVGGSGTDELTGIAQNWAGDLYVGGWTSSTDLHTVKALQPAPAGGEDGLFAVFDYEGGLHHLTYFGGSGDDRIRDVHVNYNLVARVAGSTRSQDLPQQAATQTRGHGMEGFIADIGSDYLAGGFSLILAKDGMTTMSFRPGRTALRQPVTYRSSDPSRVRLVYLGRSFSEVTAPVDSNIQVEGLADSGEAEIQISAEGYDSKTVRVRLYPGVFAFTDSSAQHIFSTWSSTRYLSPYYQAIDPATGQRVGTIQTLRPGAVKPVFQWTVSDPSIVKLTVTGTYAQLSFLRAGETTVSLSASGYTVIGDLALQVQPPALTFPAAGIRLGRDLTNPIPFSFLLNGTSITSGFRGTLTARSGDPSRLLLSAASDRVGQERVTINLVSTSSAIYAQALAGDGPVTVYFTSDQFEGEVPATIVLEPMVVNWGFGRYASSSNPAASDRLSIASNGAQTAISIVLQSESGTQGAYRPGLPPLVFKLRNSNPQVLEQNRVTAEYGNTGYAVTPLAPGSADLTLTVSDPNLRVSPQNVPVDVTAPVLVVMMPPSTVWVGKNLQTSFLFRYFGKPPVEAVSEDPSAVVLSQLPTEPGTGRLFVQPREYSSDYYTVWVQALKGEGETRIRLRFPTGEEVTVRVVLMASTAGFTGQPTSYSSGGVINGRVNVGVWSMDAAAREAVGVQTPAPGREIEVRFRVEGAPLQLSRNSVKVVAGSQQELTYVRTDTTKASVLIAEADGDFAPIPSVASIVFAATTISTVPTSLGTVDVPQNGLRSFTYSLPSPKPMTVTSSDPALALVSVGAQDAGSASIRMEKLTATIYIHGVAASGQAKLRFEQEGATPLELIVSLVPLQVSLSEPSVPAGASASLPLSLNAPSGLRPGAGPVHVAFRVADPAIARVSPEAVDYDGTASTGTVTITGVAVGATSLFLDTGQDVFAPGSPYSLVVSTPQAQTVAYSIGKNQQGGVQLDLGSNFNNPSGAIVTLTSSDPSRLVLSRSQTTAGSASITVSVPAGDRRTQTIYMQALETGSASISASGISQPIATVQVADSWWSCGTQPVKLVTGSVQTLSCGLSTPSVSYALTLSLRPGLGDLRVGFSSSAADVFTVTPDSAPITSGYLQVALKALKEGAGELHISQPAGFGPSANGADVLSITVGRPQLGTNCSSSPLLLGKDTQVTCRLGGVSGITVTAKSEDPNLLLVSGDDKQAGGASVTSVADAQGAPVTFQALAGYGTAEVVFSAAGYQDLRVPVVLRGIGVVFGSYYGTSNINLSVGDLTTLNVQLRRSDGVTATPRAGIKIPIGITVAPQGVVSLTPAEVALSRDQSSPTVQIRGVAAGSALLSLTVPDGFTPPAAPTLITVPK